jgi:hypothetical protein
MSNVPVWRIAMINTIAELRAALAAGEKIVVSNNNVDLRGTYLSGADLSGADLSDADLSGADLSDADLSDADLSDANLNGTNLSDAALSDADLSDADLRNANLNGTNLSDAALSNADLRNANLNGTNLRGADLRNADLRNANLNGTNLRDADLRGVNLRGANLSGTDLREAKLSRHLIAVTSESIDLLLQFCRIVVDSNTALNCDNLCDATHCGAGLICTLSQQAKLLEGLIGWNAATCLTVPIPEFTGILGSTNEEMLNFAAKTLADNGDSLRAKYLAKNPRA